MKIKAIFLLLTIFTLAIASSRDQINSSRDNEIEKLNFLQIESKQNGIDDEESNSSAQYPITAIIIPYVGATQQYQESVTFGKEGLNFNQNKKSIPWLQ